MNAMKYILSILLISLLTLCVSAQNETHCVSFIPHAGISVSKMDGTALQGTKTWKVGYTAGVGVEIPLSQYYSLTTGADISLIGTGFEERKEKYASAEEKLNVAYISVPLMIKAYFHGVKGLSAHFGVAGGVLISARDKVRLRSIRTMNLGDGTSSMYLWEHYTEKQSQNVSSHFRNIVAGFPLGLGYEWHHVTLDATYCFEVRKAIHQQPSDSWGTTYEALTSRNYPILITAGYKFTL